VRATIIAVHNNYATIRRPIIALHAEKRTASALHVVEFTF
jgi:hypothetical protein